MNPDEWVDGDINGDFPVVDAESLTRLARCLAHPVLTGTAADAVVEEMVKWAQSNDWADAFDRDCVWRSMVRREAGTEESGYSRIDGPGVFTLHNGGIDLHKGEEVLVNDDSRVSWRGLVIGGFGDWVVIEVVGLAEDDGEGGDSLS